MSKMMKKQNVSIIFYTPLNTTTQLFLDIVELIKKKSETLITKQWVRQSGYEEENYFKERFSRQQNKTNKSSKEMKNENCFWIWLRIIFPF